MLTTQLSAWFIPLCLLVGAGYAALQYSAKAPWGKRRNYALAALRFAVVSFLCYLLLAPVIKTTTTHTEAPTVVLAVDNSQSVALFTPRAVLGQATSGLAKLAETLRGRGFTVETRTLTATPGRPARLDSLRGVLQNVTSKVDRGDGTLGKLVNDPRLYDDAKESVAALKTLIEDIRKNPKKYINLRVF